MGNVPQFKTCPKCKETRLLSEFHRNPARYDGRTSYCRYCRITPKAKEREELLPKGMYRCTRCGEIKPLVGFSKNSLSTSGYMSKCKECDNELRRQRRLDNIEEERRKDRARNLLRHDERMELCKRWYAKNKQHAREYNRRYYEENREAVLELNRQWRINHPHRLRTLKRNYKARKRGAVGDHTDEQFQALIEYYGRLCLCCGEDTKLTADHVVPVSWGGSNYISNIQPLCRPCNSAKKNHHDTDYRPDGGAFARSLEREVTNEYKSTD